MKLQWTCFSSFIILSQYSKTSKNDSKVSLYSFMSARFIERTLYWAHASFLQTFKLEIARFARNIVKMRLFEMIFRYSVMYFAALHIEPRVAQQCFWSKLANDVRKVAGNKKFLLGRRRKAGEPEKCIKCIKKSCDDKGLYKSKRIRLCCTTSIHFFVCI